MKNKDTLFGIYMLLFSIVPIAGFSSLLFLNGSQSIIVIWTFLIVAILLTAVSFKKQKVLASISLVVLLATASLMTFAAMMAGMTPE
ncbi:hypothetical protein QRD89_07395 [Halobacillus sp. ACCC02827]|uniref:hypothetical protein n=1 Tax=unclassified Halobacillus TaxID=2636472 RepID=UPI00078073AD|nr:MULTISPECIES: hypothetical protein [unclassified Halobacillus]WJE17167.1 hypothetical protein QRD89_07395 [Halobacillus sp. ACCC02827]